jgi:endonuclease I
MKIRRLVAALAAVSLTSVGVVVVAVGAPAPARAAETAPSRAPHDPATYYAGTAGLSGNALALELNSIIDGNTFLPYTSGATDVWDALKVLDRDPSNPGRIIDAYSGDSLDAANQCGSSCALDGWNREHTWAQSRGSFNTAAGPGTDLFHMRPLRGNTNSSRGNKDFDDGGTANVPGCGICRSDGDSFEPRAGIKGDLARGLFYMDVRFNGDADDAFGVDLRMWDTVGGSGTQLGKLSTLVAWSLADPPDAGERNRNDLIDELYQHNRNPFIDHPEWVCSIWGDQVPAGLCADDNAAPTTAPMDATTAEDTGTTVPLMGSDADGDALTWTVAQAPAHGTASITGPTLTYTPTADFSGTDVVGVTVSDGRGGTATTTVTITVTPVNDAPSAVDVVASTPRGTATQVALSGSDPDGDALTYTIASPPAHGTVSVDGSTATYTPTAGYTGGDSFTYRAGDGAAQSAPATVSITVNRLEQSPTANAAVATTPEDEPVDVVLTASDPDDDPLTYALGLQPQHGTVTLSGDVATYTPAPDFHGTDTFTFTASDATTTTSAPAAVSVTVSPVNDRPTVTGAELRTTAGTPVTATLQASDPDGDPVTISSVTQPENGSVTSTGLSITYTPATRSGTETFTVTVSDGRGGEASAEVDVETTPRAAELVVTAPRATRGTPTTVTITATGPEGPTPTGAVELRSGATVLGTATLGPDGTATVPVTPVTAGDRPLTASYAGDALFAPTSGETSQAVARSASTLRFSATGALRRGRPGVLRVSVRTVAGVAATGRVTLAVGRRTLTSAATDGTARFRIARLPRQARLTVVARYSGDSQYASDFGRHTYRLRR